MKKNQTVTANSERVNALLVFVMSRDLFVKYSQGLFGRRGLGNLGAFRRQLVDIHDGIWSQTRWPKGDCHCVLFHFSGGDEAPVITNSSPPIEQKWNLPVQGCSQLVGGSWLSEQR